MKTYCFKFIPAVLLALVVFIASTHHAHAATCVPGTNMATVTNAGVTVPAAGSYKVWVRVAAAQPLAVKARLEITPSGGTATCFDVVNPAPTTTSWQWVPLGPTSLTATGNTVKLVGVDVGVRIDRVIYVAATSTCTPSNTRVLATSTSPAVEPGDNCLATATTTSTTSTTTTVTTQPPAAAIPVPTNFKAVAGEGIVSLSWDKSTDARVDEYSPRYIRSDSTTKSDGSTWIYPGRTSGTTYSVTGLTPGVSYDFQIRAIDNLGTSDPADDVKSEYTVTVVATPMSPTTVAPPPTSTVTPPTTTVTPCVPGDKKNPC